jgi:hypothetical protein
VLILLLLLAAGIAETWPRASYLITSRVPFDSDQTQYVWSLWWVARAVTHLQDPWFTNYLAAPVGVRLGYDTLIPLLGLIMSPVTLVFGAPVSYNVLVIVAPGLAAYAMYRAAALWVRSRTGAIAAGAFFGLSSMLTSQAWDHIHTALGAVFLPLTVEAAVRLRRRPAVWRAILLGVVIGASIMVDQEATIMAAALAVLILVPWLLRRGTARELALAAGAAVVAVVVASPQLLAMVQEAGRGGPSLPPLSNYVNYAAELPSLFSPSPSLGRFGLSALSASYSAHTDWEMAATFGVVLSALALLGLVVGWRRAASWQLALLWAGGAALALGPTLYISVSGRQIVPFATRWHGVRMSLLMPYTWLIRLPLMSSFREADRFALLGLVGAALLAGAGVDWLRRRAWPLVIVVAVLGALEAGWAGDIGQTSVPAALPSLDRPIAADHTHSVVVDVPFIIRGPQYFGLDAPSYALELAAADGHPRAISITSDVPKRTLRGIRREAFYATLLDAEYGLPVGRAQLAAARHDLSRLDVGWVLVWTPRWTKPNSVNAWPKRVHYREISRFLAETGFRYDYRADGVLVYRPAGALRH